MRSASRADAPASGRRRSAASRPCRPPPPAEPALAPAVLLDDDRDVEPHQRPRVGEARCPRGAGSRPPASRRRGVARTCTTRGSRRAQIGVDLGKHLDLGGEAGVVERIVVAVEALVGRRAAARRARRRRRRPRGARSRRRAGAPPPRSRSNARSRRSRPAPRAARSPRRRRSSRSSAARRRTAAPRTRRRSRNSSPSSAPVGRGAQDGERPALDRGASRRGGSAGRALMIGLRLRARLAAGAATPRLVLTSVNMVLLTPSRNKPARSGRRPRRAGRGGGRARHDDSKHRPRRASDCWRRVRQRGPPAWRSRRASRGDLPVIGVPVPRGGQLPAGRRRGRA